MGEKVIRIKLKIKNMNEHLNVRVNDDKKGQSEKPA